MVNLNDILAAARAMAAAANPDEKTEDFPVTLADDIGDATEQVLGHRVSPSRTVDHIEQGKKTIDLLTNSFTLVQLMKLMPDMPWERAVDAISNAVDRGSEAVGRDTPVVVRLIINYLRGANPLLVAACLNGGLVTARMYLDASDKLDVAQKRIVELEAEVARMKGAGDDHERSQAT